MTEIFKICKACHGHKQIMRMGMMRGDCEVCKGVGKVKYEPEIITATPKVESEIVTEEIQHELFPECISIEPIETVQEEIKETPKSKPKLKKKLKKKGKK